MCLVRRSGQGVLHILAVSMAHAACTGMHDLAYWVGMCGRGRTANLPCSYEMLLTGIAYWLSGLTRPCLGVLIGVCVTAHCMAGM